MARNWIKGAVRKPGAFKAQAKRAGKSTKAFAKEHAHDSGRTGKRARLALTFSRMSKGRKGKKATKRAGRRRSRR